MGDQAKPQSASFARRGVRTAATALLCLTMLTPVALAQEATYSSDSLMATFEKASQVSLKGKEISFRDVVIESRNSKLTFKSSQNGKVFCELTRQQNTPAPVGSMLRVTGKVRGRGLLGNVTLDECTIAPADEPVAAAQPPIPTEIPTEAGSIPPADAVTEAVPPAVSAPDPVTQPAKALAPARNVAAPRPVIAPAPPERAPLVDPSSPEAAVKETALASRKTPYGFYALLVLSGAVGTWILPRLLAPMLLRLRFTPPSATMNTPETRQAALQALLQKASRK